MSEKGPGWAGPESTMIFKKATQPELTFEQFRRRVIGYAGSALWREPPVPGMGCTTCGHAVPRHGLVDGCDASGCGCPLTWVAAGLAALGLPPDYKFAEVPRA